MAATAQTLLAPTAHRPAPPSLPTWHPLGHLLRFRDDPLGLFVSAMEVGDVVRFRVAHRWIHAVYHPDAIQHVLVHRAQHYAKKTRGYENLRALLGGGLLTAEGEAWRRERRVVQPVFNHSHLPVFAATMTRATEDLADRWERQGAEPFDLARSIHQLALRIAGETLFSMDVSGESSEVSDALDTVLGGFLRAVIHPIRARLPTRATRAHRAAVGTLDRIVRGIVARRRAEGGAQRDLLGLLMSARDEQTGEAMSDEQLRDEVLTMLLAGHETTANALSWTLYRLSQHPEADARLADELGGLSGSPGLEQLPGLSWTDAVLRETLRLHPPAWVESRMALEEDEIQGYRIPKGGFVFMSQYAIHRHPKLWVDPLRYDPTRFLPGQALCPDGSPRPKLAWFPFGAGPRKCIGEGFAMMEAKLIIASLARRFRFELAPGWQVREEPTVTLRPKGGLWMRVTPR